MHARVRDHDIAWTGAWEAVPVSPAGTGRFRVEAVPFHRVGCTYGDVVEVVTEPCRGGARRVIDGMVEPSGRRTVLVRLDTSDAEAVAALETAFERLLAAPHELDDEVPATRCAIAVDRRDEGVVADVAELYGHDVLEYL